jgi:hypothetical protein
VLAFDVCRNGTLELNSGTSLICADTPNAKFALYGINDFAVLRL